MGGARSPPSFQRIFFGEPLFYEDRKSTRLNSSHGYISYAVFCLKKKNLLISKHYHKRLYFASNKLFRTDDQGNTWREISGDMSRGIDRHKLTVMLTFWIIDAVAQ